MSCAEVVIGTDVIKVEIEVPCGLCSVDYHRHAKLVEKLYELGCWEDVPDD